MRYTEEDFEADFMFVSNRQGEYQKEGEEKPLGKKCDKKIEIDGFENEILKLNTVLRVDHHMRTPYSIHMSYPSARSLYTINLYILYQGYVVSKDFFGENIVFQIENEELKTKGLSEGDIIIEVKNFKDPHYPCIYKTLQNLETGHLLYNIASIAGIYGIQYIVDNCLENFMILRRKGIFQPLENDKACLKEFWEKARLRSSGKYYGGLINFEADYERYRFFPEKMKTMKEIVFKNKPEKSIKTILLLNDGNRYIDEQYQIECSYQKLMKEYSYVNFRTQSQIYMIILKKSQKETVDYAEVIQYMGMMAQEICLENAHKDVFNRPVKQVMQQFWKGVLYQNNAFANDIPFYGVITGKESVGRTKYKLMV